MSETLALHGFVIPINGDWEVIVNQGDYDRGHVVVAGRREARFNITWDRRSRQPNFERTLRKLGRHMFSQHKAMVAHVEALGNNGGSMAAYEAPDGRYHALAFQPDSDSSLTLIIRQLMPGAPDELRQLAKGTWIARPEQHIVWRLHGIAVDLPPAWRLQGIQQYSGLARAVWFRCLPGKQHKHDQIVVMRRFACASRVLADTTIRQWIETRLRSKEEITEDHTDHAGVWHAVCRAPGDTLWRRVRGIEDIRHLHVWVEPEMDRLIIQEWQGLGDPLPALRVPTNRSQIHRREHAA